MQANVKRKNKTMRTKHMEYIVSGASELKVNLLNATTCQIEGHNQKFTTQKFGNNTFKIATEKMTFDGEIQKIHQNQCCVNINGNSYTFNITPIDTHKRNQQLQTTNEQKHVHISAPLPGKLIETFVSPNQKVKKGETLAVLEAMKMQNEIQSPINGRVTKIAIPPKGNVMKDQVFIEMVPE